MTATGQSTKAARRTGRQEPRTGGAMQGPLVKYPSEVSCKYLSHSADSSIACFSDKSVDSFVFPAWQPDTWTSFCMMADKGNRTFKGGDLLPQDAYYHYSDLHFQATLDGVPLYNTTSYKGGHKKGQLVTLFGDEEWLFPARGSITDLHIWSRIITEKGLHSICNMFVFCSLHTIYLSEMQDYSNCKTVADGDLFSWDTAKLTLQDSTDIVIKSVSYSSHIQL